MRGSRSLLSAQRSVTAIILIITHNALNRSNIYLECSVYPLRTCSGINIRVTEEQRNIQSHVPLASSGLLVDCDCLSSTAQMGWIVVGHNLILRRRRNESESLGIG